MRVDRYPGDGWVVAHPKEEGLPPPSVLVDLPGEIVSGHPDRHVREVTFRGRVCYLKREHRIPWRERWKNLLAGFGWASKSTREAAVLMWLE